MFQLWCLGEPEKQIPPYRTLAPMDVGDDTVAEQQNKRRRLADLRGLMVQFEDVRYAIRDHTNTF